MQCGLVEIKNFWENKRQYLDHDWTQEPRPWIDPQKEANANKTALLTGQKTYKQISAEAGRDWRDQVDDIAEVINYGNEKGIDMMQIMFNVTPVEEVQDEHGNGNKG